MSMMNAPAPALSSSPASPAVIRRRGAAIEITASASGIVIDHPGEGRIAFTVDLSLELLDLLRTPGVRNLITRAWLAEQHAAVIEATE